MIRMKTMPAQRRYNGRASFAKGEQGVVLLESLIAILIFSLGVLGIVGLQGTMIKNTSDAKYRSEASYIAQQKIGEMWADPTNIPPDLDDEVDISGLLPNGTRKVTQQVAGRYLVEVKWQQPGEPEHTFTTIANVAGG